MTTPTRSGKRDEPVTADAADPALHQLRAELGWLGGVLGPVRDADVLLARLRYTGELARTGGGRRIGRLVKATERSQDVLGEHQDACVARQRVARLLGGLGDAAGVDVAFVAGRLAEREEISRAAARQAWPAAWQRVGERAAALRLG